MRRKTIDAILVLSDAMKSIVSTFSKSRFFSSGLVKRASIVLLVSQGSTRALYHGLGFMITMLPSGAAGFLRSPIFFALDQIMCVLLAAGVVFMGLMCVNLGRSRNRLFQFEEEFVYKGDVYYVSENQEEDIGIF